MIGPLALKRVDVMFIKANGVINYQVTLKISKMREFSSRYRLNLGSRTCDYKYPFHFHHVTRLYAYISAFCEARAENRLIKLIPSDFQNKKTKMSGTYSTYGGEGRFILVG
jgi:hypothetical protein